MPRRHHSAGSRLLTTAVGTSGSAGFDPATLNLSGWFRDYSGVPWNGSTSGSTSGDWKMASTGASNDPAVSAALNTHTGADFDGTLFGGDKVKLQAVSDSANKTLADLITASAWSVSVLVNIDAIVGSSNGISADPLLSETAGYWGIFLRNNAGALTALAYQFAGGDIIAAATVATGSPTLIQAKYDGTNVKIRVDGGSWTSTAGGSVGALTGQPHISHSHGITYFNGKVYDVITAKTALSDADMDSLVDYVNSRYGTAF